MEDVNFLLSDRYVEFAMKIIDLRNEQKLIKAKLDEHCGEYNALVSALWSIQHQATQVQKEFEAWKKECLANCGDG